MIFLTGANGLIGSHLVVQLIQKGDKVKALKRSNSSLELIPKDIQDQIEWVEGDVLDYHLLETEMKDCQTVIHTAAIVSFNPKDKDLMFQINVEGTANVVNAALAVNVPKFIHVSSVAALGRSETETIISEETKWVDSPYNSIYAVTKNLAEREVWRAAEEGLNVSIINPSIVIGEGNWNNSSVKLLKQIYDFGKFYPDSLINYVDVKDVVLILDALVRNPKKGLKQRYVLNGGRVSYFDFFTEFAVFLGCDRPQYKIPFWMMGIFRRIEWLRSKLLGQTPLVTTETVRVLLKPTIYKTEKVNQEFGIEFTNLSLSAERISAYLIQKYNLN